MSEVKTAHARSRPHRKRLRNLNSGICFYIEQMPERPFLGVIRTCRITCCRPNAPIFFLNKVCVVQVFRATIAPLVADAFMQALSKSLSQTIGQGLSHDCVAIVVLRPV